MMAKKDYIENIENSSIDEQKVDAINQNYHCNLSEYVSKIISAAEDSVFFEDEYRAMAYKEILNADFEHDVAFTELGLIPIIDCYDNDYIVYIIRENKWAKFNLVDEVLFKKRDTLRELL